MAVIETWLNQDLQNPVKVQYIDGNLFSNNANGNKIGVNVTNGGAPVTLSGTVTGYVVLCDGTTVPCTGAKSGNKASILIPAAAYLPGSVFISIFITDDETVTTLAAVSTSVLMTRTGTQVDPGSVVSDWTDTINAAMQEVEEYAAAVGGNIAPSYDSLTFPVPLGKLTIYGDVLYRCTTPIETSETWTPAHWTQTTIDSEFANIDSELDNIDSELDNEREDISTINNRLNIMQDASPFPSDSFTLKMNVDGSGNITTNNYTAISERVSVSKGDKVIRLVPDRDSNNIYLLFYVSQFKGQTFVSRTQLEPYGNSLLIGAGVDNIIISFGRQSSSGVQITSEDVTNYFSALLYRRVTVEADDFIIRGKISDLGYTALSQCIEPGYYFFRSTDALSDLPSTWTGGGVLLTFRNDIADPGTTWQKLVSTIGSFVRYGVSGTWYADFALHGSISSLGYTALSQCVTPGYYFFSGSDSLSDLPKGWTGGGFLVAYTKEGNNVIWQQLSSAIGTYIRYGATGAWYNKHINNLVYAKYDSDSGDDSSTEQLNIYIPIDDSGRTMRYNMGHCVDQDKNADVWRIMYSYLVNSTGSSNRKMTINGEWECAVKLDGRPDFSGGIVHGDEVVTAVTAYVDGVQTAISAIDGYCKELKIVRYSNLYDPNNNTTIIAEHGVEYIYNLDGVQIKQAVNWKVSDTLLACYLAMLPIAKAYSKYRYDDTSFNVVENTSSNYSVTIPNAKSVTQYSDTYECMFTMGVDEYPTGLPGGDCALIGDNGGLGYNKVYFPVCTSGTITTGTLWKSTTIISNR